MAAAKTFLVSLDQTYEIRLDLKAIDWFRDNYAGKGIFSALQDPDPRVALLLVMAGLRWDPRHRSMEYEQFRDRVQAWLDEKGLTFMEVTKRVGAKFAEYIRDDTGEGEYATVPLALGSGGHPPSGAKTD